MLVRNRAKSNFTLYDVDKQIDNKKQGSHLNLMKYLLES